MTKIAHLSDLHVRNLKYHDEYLKCFDNLYESLKAQVPDYIVFTGDLVHQKSLLSAELVQICSDFLKNLSNIAPLIIIPGNHDAVINNLSRLDSISPIVGAIDSENITYYKKSGVYFLNSDIDLVVFSCLDQEKDWPQEKDININKISIGLYHGMLNGAYVNDGVNIDNSYNLDFFMSKCDYLMCGDLHEYQSIGNEKKVFWAGSLIQQNYGEGRTKGFLLWNIKSKKEHTVEFIQLPNICPFYTLKLKDDLLISDRYKVQKGSRIRVESKQLSIFQEKEIRDKLQLLYEPVEIIFKDDINAHRQEIKKGSKTKIENLSNLLVQEKLIKEFLKLNKLDDSLMNKVLELNKKYDLVARNNDDVLRNINYKILKYGCSNFCSFAEDNEIDLTKYSGILGLFGSNASGKSSISVDVLGYIIGNRISKNGVVKNDHLINEKKEYCSGHADIRIDDDVYTIERKTDTYLKAGKRKGVPVVQGRTDVNFSVTYKDGTEELKNREDRQETDKLIRQIFGSLEDFITTSVAPQWQLLNFIDIGSTDRQKIIARYFDIDIFEDKYKLANEDKKGIKEKIKLFDSTSFDENIARYEQEIKDISIELQKNKDKQLELDIDKKNIELEISDLKSKLINTKFLMTEQEVEKANQDCLEKIVLKNKRILDIDGKINSIFAENKQLMSEFVKYDIKLLERDRRNYNSFSNSKKDLSSAITQQGEVIDRMKMYECIKNKNCNMLFELNKREVEKKIFENELDKTIKELNNIDIKKTEEDIEKFHKIEKLLDRNDIKKIEEEREEQNNLLQEYYSNAEKYKIMKEEIQKNKNNILDNENIKIQIKMKEFGLRKQEQNIRILLENYMELNKKVGIKTGILQEEIKKKEIYKNALQEYEAYDYYLKTMSKDGISQMIVMNNLDVINGEIEKILNGNVPFSVTLEANENKEIEIYFCADKGKKRIIEICSGMEKTFASLAIRVALVNITTLPKSNIFILDEVFNSLSGEYLDIAIKILQILKQMFDTVIIVTHNEILKDCVDYCIEIDRDENGFSRLN